MRVLILPSWYPSDDAPLYGIYFREQAQALREQGVGVGVVYPEARSLRSLRPGTLRRQHFQERIGDEAGIPTVRLLGWNLWWRWEAGARFRIRAAERLARRYVERFGRPDLVHAQSARWAGAAAARIARRYEIPYVVTEHFSGFARGTLPGWQRRLAREGFAGAAQVVAVSRALGRLLVEQGLVAAPRVRILPNPVDPAFFAPPPERPPRPPCRLFTLGQLYPWKRVDLLLRAFARLLEAFPDARLEVGGDGPERRALEALAAGLGLRGKATFLGGLSREQVRQAMGRAHAFVHASRYETFSLVLAEAMATGLPVLTTAAGGPEDLVVPGVGVHAPGVDDPEALAGQLRRFVERLPGFDAGAIRRHAVERFGTPAVTARLVSLYEEVLAAYRQ